MPSIFMLLIILPFLIAFSLIFAGSVSPEGRIISVMIKSCLTLTLLKLDTSNKIASAIELSEVLILQKSAFGSASSLELGLADFGDFVFIFKEVLPAENESAKKHFLNFLHNSRISCFENCSSTPYCLTPINCFFDLKFSSPVKSCVETTTPVTFTLTPSGIFSAIIATRSFAYSEDVEIVNPDEEREADTSARFLTSPLLNFWN